MLEVANHAFGTKLARYALGTELARYALGTELARYALGTELDINATGTELAFPHHDRTDDVPRCMFCVRLSSEHPAPCLWETHTGHSTGLWMDSTCTTNMVPDTSLILHWPHSDWQEEGRSCTFTGRAMCVESGYTSQYRLHTAHYTLQTAYCTLHTVY